MTPRFSPPSCLQACCSCPRSGASAITGVKTPPTPTSSPAHRSLSKAAGACWRDEMRASASVLPPAPFDGGPDPLMKIIPEDLGYDLEAGDRSRDLDPAGQEPADRKGVERAQRPPADRFQNRPRMCLCSTN